MRDYNSTYDLDYNPYAETSERNFGGVRTIAMIGAIALIATPAIMGFARRWRSKQNTAKTEPAIDESLKETYPASDPPASRYFDIPENRL